MITRIFVFDPGGNPCNPANTYQRHKRIIEQIEGFELYDHKTLDYISDRAKTIQDWDKDDALIIVHFSDIPDCFKGLKDLKNAQVICHTDSWNNNADPMNHSRFKMDTKGDYNNMKNKNYHLTGSDKVLANLCQFLAHLKTKGEVRFEIIEGFIIE